MTCHVCGKEDHLQVLSEHLCRSCFDSEQKGVHFHDELIDLNVQETIPHTQFFYQQRVRGLYRDVCMPTTPLFILG